MSSKMKVVYAQDKHVTAEMVRAFEQAEYDIQIYSRSGEHFAGKKAEAESRLDDLREKACIAIINQASLHLRNDTAHRRHVYMMYRHKMDAELLKRFIK